LAAAVPDVLITATGSLSVRLIPDAK